MIQAVRTRLVATLREALTRALEGDQVQPTLDAWLQRGARETSGALTSVGYEPPPYRTPPSTTNAAARDDIVFVTARFRSGSTALWNALRALPELTTYYEPFNERRFFDPNTRGGSVDPSHIGVDDYWREYDGMDALGLLYNEDWIRRDLYMDERSIDSRMKRFVEMLVERAEGRPILQFNRADFRLPWLRSRFPNARIVHLYRDVREQWCSSLMHLDEYPCDASNDMFRDRFYLRAWINDLKHTLPFLRETHIEEHPYRAFYLIWRSSWLFGRYYADMSISFEDLVRAPKPTLGKLAEALDLGEDAVKKMRPMIASTPKPRALSWASEDWYCAHEAVCEPLIRDFFGAEKYASPRSRGTDHGR